MVMIENIHHGDYLDRSKVIRTLNVSAIGTIEAVYQRGVAEGVFRPGLDPIELHWQVSALCFFNVSNRTTFSKIFGRDFGAPEAQTVLRHNVVDMVLRYVVTDGTAGGAAPAKPAPSRRKSTASGARRA